MNFKLFFSFCLVVGIMMLNQSYAQSTNFTYKVIKSGSTPVFSSERFDTEDTWQALVTSDIQEAPKPFMEIKRLKDSLDGIRMVRGRSLNKTYPRSVNGSELKPGLGKNFEGGPTGGTPTDNNVAVSDSGVVISVHNQFIKATREDGTLIYGSKLKDFPKGTLGTLNRTYDPKVLYDPEADRFIIVYLNEVLSHNNGIVVGFSATNDPAGVWNYYALEGNYLKDTSWADYPIIALSRDELFITVNLLKDNGGWKEGFKQSVIWQIGKAKGYSGQTLDHNVFHDIKYNGKPVWSICPVQGGKNLTSPNMYFLSVRPSAQENDTVFLHEITNNISSGNAQLTMKVLKADKKYGVPPSARQPDGQFLETNDTRVLSAIFHENKIQYVQTTLVKDFLSSGVFHGIISNVNNISPVINANIIGADSLDFAYPSIAYAGNSPGDQSSMITFSHVSSVVKPGTSAIFFDRQGFYSEILRVKEGESSINVLADTFERWGDYTGIQRKYGEQNAFWISGSFGKTNGIRTWVAKVISKEGAIQVSIPNSGVTRDEKSNYSVFPNPAFEIYSVKFEVRETESLDFLLTDVSGKVVHRLLTQKLEPGTHQLSFNAGNLKPGVYFVSVRNEKGARRYQSKLVVE